MTGPFIVLNDYDTDWGNDVQGMNVLLNTFYYFLCWLQM